MGSDRTLYIYRPDEILRGAVPFYTGRFVEEIYDRSLLLNVLDRKDRILAIVMGKRGDLEGKSPLQARDTTGSTRRWLRNAAICSSQAGRMRVLIDMTNEKNGSSR